MVAGGRQLQADAVEPNENLLGKVTEFDASKGYGFINSEDALNLCGASQVWFSEKVLGKCQVGDLVTFSMMHELGRRPKALEVRPRDSVQDPATNQTSSGTATAQFSKDSATFLRPIPDFSDNVNSATGDGDTGEEEEEEEENVHEGHISAWDDTKGFGFIKCRTTFAKYVRDVFLRQAQKQGFAVKDKVRFTVKLNKHSKPQAMQLTALSASHDSNSDAGEMSRDQNRNSTAVTKGDKRQMFTGTVKYLSPDGQYGFIKSLDTYDVYKCDVFFPCKQGNGFALGDQVCFSVKKNSRGKPQAERLYICESNSAPEDFTVDVDTEIKSEDVTATGTIKSFDAEKGYGFISSPEASETYGRDVFLHRAQIKDFKPGDHVRFIVRINSHGHPQAHKLREAPITVGWLAGGDDGHTPEQPDNEQYIGEIKSFSTPHGYGFIECEALKHKYHRDVFIHQLQFNGLRVGETVSFFVQMKRGQPQARDVERYKPSLGKDPNIKTESKQDPPQLSSDQVLALSRKLLRACASATVESPLRMEELLSSRADPNACDVTGQTALMVSALCVRDSEKKCRVLIDHGADPTVPCHGDRNAIDWARERINPNFAELLQAMHEGDAVEYAVVLDRPPGDEF